MNVVMNFYVTAADADVAYFVTAADAEAFCLPGETWGALPTPREYPVEQCRGAGGAMASHYSEAIGVW